MPIDSIALQIAAQNAEIQAGMEEIHHLRAENERLTIVCNHLHGIIGKHDLEVDRLNVEIERLQRTVVEG